MTTIHVTHACIENGVRDDCKTCPVARAFNLAFGGQWHVYVAHSIAGAAFEAEGVRYCLLPWEESDRILQYDSTGEMEPHSFDVELKTTE